MPHSIDDTTRSAQNVTLALAAVAFALMGVFALWKPLLVTRQFEIFALQASGRNEVRAVYGGFGLTMSFALCAAIASSSLRGGIAFTVALALSGMAAGRLFSAGIDRRFDRLPMMYCALESSASALLLWVWRTS
jgi:Domain of unknown function (DUF4345)